MIQLFDEVQLLECDETLWFLRVGRVIRKDGKPLEQDVQAFRTQFNVQPTSGKDLQLVPEGYRFREALSVWQPVRAGMPLLGLDCKVLRSGKVYQVQHADQWEGSYSQAIVVRIDVQGEAAALAQFRQHMC